MNEPESPRRGDRIAFIETTLIEPPRVVVRGDVDFRNAHEITEAVRELMDRGEKRVDVYLAAVEFMDSSGISALLDSVNLARERDARLVLVQPTRELLHLLEMSGFKPLFEFEGVTAAAPVPQPVTAPVWWQVSEFRVPCHPELVADIRHRIAEVARSMPFDLEEVEDIKLAVGEAAANAYRYGCPRGAEDSIYVRCVGDYSGLTIEISDPGPGFDPDSVAQPPVGSLTTGGRGIFFMRLTMDKVHFERLDPGMLVRLVKFLRHHGSSDED